MSNLRDRPPRQRVQTQRGKPRVDLWKPTETLPPPEPVVPSEQPTTLVRSLGAPPLQRDDVASYFEIGVARASMMANALLASAGLLATATDPED